MLFGDMVKKCDSQVNECRRCENKDICLNLQRNGIPKPYQYKGISNVSILKEDVQKLVSRARNV